MACQSFPPYKGGDKSFWWLVIETKNTWWFGDLYQKKLVIWWFQEGVVMVIYLKKVWWFGVFGHKILVIWWFTGNISILILNGAEIHQNDGLTPNLSEFSSKTTRKLVMVIKAKKSWWFGDLGPKKLVIWWFKGGSGPPPLKHSNFVDYLNNKILSILGLY